MSYNAIYEFCILTTVLMKREENFALHPKPGIIVQELLAPYQREMKKRKGSFYKRERERERERAKSVPTEASGWKFFTVCWLAFMFYFIPRLRRFFKPKR